MFCCFKVFFAVNLPENFLNGREQTEPPFVILFNQWQSNEHIEPGADLGFSQGGWADFQKIFDNFDDLFF